MQKICLQILRHETLKYQQKKDKIYGILFDGAWLWEEYLNTILKDCGYAHPENKKRKGKIYLFQNNKAERYPDFYKEQEGIVLDAKYKRFNTRSIDKEDINQIIVYMFRLKATHGGFIYPIAHEEEDPPTPKEYGTLNGYGGTVYNYGVLIPKGTSYQNFCSAMEPYESQLKDTINKIET